MLRRSPLKPGSGFKSAAFAKSERKEASAVKKIRKPMKSRGMKGRSPTADEDRFMSAIASLGCLACAKDGVENSLISIHHIDGRTKPGAHFLVLGLCAPHHQQDDTDQMGRVSVHGRKAQFEARYGTQYELLAEAKTKLGLF